MISYDYIIVGAGAAGPILAARLSEDPQVQVALIEAGGENTNDVGRMQGAFFQTWGSDMNWRYSSAPQAALNGRIIDQPRGRVMGGSTAINVGAWLRGCPADYDAWETAGAAGWNWKTALDIFRSIEDTDRNQGQLRGKGGPLRMQDLPSPTPFADTLLQAFTQAGFGCRGDANGDNPFVADRYQTLFPDGVRRTPADAYLDTSVRARPNLHIYTEALVTKVNLDGQRARGITYKKFGFEHVLEARREVLLCAGAFNTPQLLMLSGIGPAVHLRKLGIHCALDSPGVGENLQDHVVVSVRGLAPAGVNVSYPYRVGPAEMEQWRNDRTGPASYWSQNGVGFVRTRPGSKGPDVELMFQYNPDTSSGVFDHISDAASRSGYTIAVILLQPKSRGSVRLMSRDPNAAPRIDPAYLSNKDDVSVLIEGVRAAQQISSTQVLQPYTKHLHPQLNSSNEDIEEWIRTDAGIAFHPVGTARMGNANDPLAVVDPELNVKGLIGIRVVDASVFPTLIRGHTMAPTVMLAERAAAMIRARH